MYNHHGEVSICLCVYLCMGGAVGRERVCACSQTSEREESRTTAHSAQAPLLPSAGKQHAPTHQALELSRPPPLFKGIVGILSMKFLREWYMLKTMGKSIDLVKFFGGSSLHGSAVYQPD